MQAITRDVNHVTSDGDFKKLVRARMLHTGQNYTQARAALLSQDPPSPPDTAASTSPSAEELVGTPAHPDPLTVEAHSGTRDTPHPDVPDWLAGADLASREFYARTVRSSYDQDTGRLHRIPGKRRAKVVVLFELLQRFSTGRIYTEPEVNRILGAAHPDFATLRRELIDYRWMHREDGRYRVSEEWPLWSASIEQEVEPFESHWFANLR